MAVIPAGEDLCSITIEPNDLPWLWSDESTDFVFDSPISVTEGNTYAIVVDTSGVTIALPVMWSQRLSNTYANGARCYSFDDGATWTSYSTRDNWFKTKSDGVVKESNTGDDHSTLNVPVFTQDQDIAAQTFTASSSYTLTSVELMLWRTATSDPMPGTATISIRNATELPVKPTNPTPSNAADDVTLDQLTVSWEDGGGATSYNVYYGTESGSLSLLESGVVDTEYTIFQITNGSPFDYEITRYWRIDAVNEAGTTTGDEWSFTTITFNTPAVGIRGFSGTGPTVADGKTNVKTRLVAFARNKVWYEDT